MQSLPGNIVADAGYGSEENYDYINDNELINYVKYNNYDYEKTSKFNSRKFLSSHFGYQPEKDQYTCPEGQILNYSTTQEITSENGYKSQKRVYQSRTCSTCPVSYTHLTLPTNRKV